MAMQPSEHRTWLSSVAFLDVVGFSKRSIQEQLEIKQHLDSVIRRRLDGINRDDFIFLDRGDGAAVCFLAEPEMAFFFTVQVRDTLRTERDSRPPYDIRAGINLGPIKIMQDVNGDPAPVGEGINCAARVMDFAGPNEILVARSFHDVIGCQSREYAELFSYLGVRADKHVRQFELYQVVPPGSQRQEAPEPTALEQPDGVYGSAPAFEPGFLEQLRAALARAIGPMADLLVTRAAHKAKDKEELLRCLGAALEDTDQRNTFYSAVGMQPPPTSSAEEAAEPEDIPPSQILDTEFQELARSALARRLGPIAAIMVKKAAAGTRDAEEFLVRLADRIPTGEERESFLIEVQSAANLTLKTSQSPTG